MTTILKKNNVTVIGEEEKVMLFAHGFGCDQNAWKYIKDAFKGQFRLVLFDHVGAGKSDLTTYSAERYDSLDGFANDILEICDELELKDIIFVGHSVSCMIGALAAIKRPDIFEKLIFIGPSPCYISDSSYIGGFDTETIDTLLEVMEEDYINWARSLAPVVMDETNNGEELTENSLSFFVRSIPSLQRILHG